MGCCRLKSIQGDHVVRVHHISSTAHFQPAPHSFSWSRADSSFKPDANSAPLRQDPFIHLIWKRQLKMAGLSRGSTGDDLELNCGAAGTNYQQKEGCSRKEM